MVIECGVDRERRSQALELMQDVAARFESFGMKYWQSMALSKVAIGSHYMNVSPGLPFAQKALEVSTDFPAARAVAWDAIAMVHMYDDALVEAANASRSAVEAAKERGFSGWRSRCLVICG